MENQPFFIVSLASRAPYKDSLDPKGKSASLSYFHFFVQFTLLHNTLGQEQ